jgi:RNA polymerase sigma-70 factor (ECF subfamily)
MLEFQKLYETNAKDVYRYAYWLTGNSFDAEDITSETMVRAWTRFNKIRTETLKAYLFKIARNVYLQQLRKRKRLIKLNDNHLSTELRPDIKTEIHFELKEIEKNLMKITEPDRSVFYMRITQELPYAEIARVMELTESAVKVKIHRVRKKLITLSLERKKYNANNP